ncbi:MAG TPA: transglycosylase SLT domain-containing protein [Bacteroidota bacterium]|nr:transglycosylase SLT domain-containing protein [Bacteroidota bacterium]
MDTETIRLPEPGNTPKVTLTVVEGTSEPQTFEFSKPFRIGRDPECQVRLNDAAVSKVHLEVFFEKEKWWARDFGSTNGTFRGGKKITKLQLGARTKLILGRTGPLLTFDVEGAAGDADKTALRTLFSPTLFVEKYLKSPDAKDNAGEQTRMIRQKVFVQEKIRSRKYVRIIIGLGVVAILATAYAVYKHLQVQKQEELAQQAFYEMKSLDIAYASLRKQFANVTGDSTVRSETNTYLEKRKKLMETYDKLVGELGIYSENMDDKEKTIYHVARVFGECEIGMPGDFVDEVENYIDLWKKSPRLRQAVARAEENGYPARIADAMLSQDLPKEFFYLALQESEFDSTVVGPETRFGIAKGMWQFMPATAMQYGLKTGPLIREEKPDPRDERQDVSKSTIAAARYISDMYNTEAQASGLLVIASYNWGHNVVRGLIREMPDNPRDRNFWRFLAQHRDKIPKQTYDYVFYIFSAAVIGENPGLWGFSMEPPFPSTAHHN